MFTVRATGQELSALVAGARLALEAMRAAPDPPPTQAIELSSRVLADFDHARERLDERPRAATDGPRAEAGRPATIRPARQPSFARGRAR